MNEAAIRAVRRKGQNVNAADFEEALMSFYSTRSISMAGLAEVAASSSSNLIPNWVKNLLPGDSVDPSPRPYTASG